MKQPFTLLFLKAKHLICFAAFILISFTSFAQYTLKPSDVKFSDGVIKAFTNTTETNIIIPNNFNGVEVTAIGSDAFKSKKLTNVFIPNTIKSIGSYAFYSNKLTNVVFEANSNIRNIWSNAFASNSGLTSIQLPTHASSGFVKYGDRNGSNYQPGAQITDFSLFYYALVPYTLTANDVTFVNGEITGYSNTVEKCIIVPDNFNGIKVTAIGARAFLLKSLTNVVLPNTITSIGSLAFYDNCLTSSLNIPSSVVSIGSSAFSRNYLKTVAFEANSNIKNIWSSAFSDNSGLAPIQLPTHASSGFVRYGDRKGSSYQPGAQITDFNLFYYALIPYTLTANDVTFVNGIITGYTNTVEKCIVIPDNLNGTKVTGIGEKAFYDKSLTSLTLPNTITSIGYMAFDNNCLTSLTIPSSVVSINSYAFNKNYLKSVVFEANSNIKNIWSSAFADNFLLSITLPTNANSKFVSYVDKNSNNYQPGAQITDFSLFYYAPVPYTLTANDVTFVDGVITGYTNTVEKCIVIPDNFNGTKVTGIGEKAFYDKSFTNLTLPNTITSIGYMAFDNNCLTSLTIPSSVVSISGWAFNSNYLKSVVFEANSNIKNIGTYAFGSNLGLSAIQLPTHASDMFVKYGDGDGKSYKPGEQITDFYTLYYALVPYTLTANDVTFVNGVITGFTNTIEKCIVIPDNFNSVTVTGIDQEVFQSKSLTSLVLPKTLQSIGSDAFYDNYLTSLTIPSSVLSIGSYSFFKNYLKSVSFEANSNIKNIWHSAFGYNSGLSAIQLPAHASDKFVKYGDGKGRSYQPDDKITNFDTYYFALAPYTLNLSDVKFSNGAITDYLNTFEKSIIIPDNFNGIKVTAIDNQAFYQNNLISVVIPNTVTSIGNSAFYNNSYLQNVAIPNSVTSIGTAAFKSNSLTSITIPSSVVTIGEQAFLYNSLKSVVFEENSNIKNIWHKAFAGNSLTSITLPTHASSKFVNYLDGNGKIYTAGNQVTDLSIWLYQLFPATNANNLKLVENVSSKINQNGEPVVYQFAGSENDLVLIKDFTSGSDLQMVLYDGFYQPIKTLVSNKKTTLDATLNRNETYYLVITSLTNSSSVNFSFSFNLLPKFKVISYLPNKVGNYGKSTLVLEGNGFSEKSTVKLFQKGQDTLRTNEVTVNRFKCNASFNFTNKAKGKWDIIVNFGDTMVTLKEGLEIENYRAPEITVELIGQQSVRPNRYTYYTIHYKNIGNANAYEVPIPITATGENVPKFEFQWETYRPDGFVDEIPDPVSSITDPVTGKITTITMPTIPMIPPSGEGYLTFGVNMNKPMDISITSGEPMFYEDPSGNIVANQNFYDCISGIKNIGTEKLQEWGLDVASDLIPGFDCYKSAYNFGGELGTQLAKSNRNMELPVVGNLAWNLTKTVTECATDFVPVTKAGKVAWGMIEAAKKIVELTEEVNGVVDGVNLANTCMKAFNGGRNNFIGARLVTSIDLNEKIGYRSPSGSNFFSNQNNFTYIINFENKSTATAAAQEVFITDTLDMKSFDINSFKAGYVRVGSKIAQAPVNVSENTWEIDMRPAMNLITKVELTLDKTKGIAHWHLKCVDPKTNDFPADALVGFLPPNDSTGRGEGCVSFTIDLKETVVDESQVNNRATIVFDYNEPIMTPTWSNRKDVIAPTSSMTSPETVADHVALLSWSGKDNKNGSGIYCYNLYMKKDNGGYETLLSRTSKTAIEFAYESGAKYSFYVTAVDSAENAEVKTNIPEVTINTTDVKTLQMQDEHSVSVFPNPNDGIFTVTTSYEGESQLSVTSISGQKVYGPVPFTQSTQVDLMGLPRGFYFCVVKNLDQAKTVKIQVK